MCCTAAVYAAAGRDGASRARADSTTKGWPTLRPISAAISVQSPFNLRFDLRPDPPCTDWPMGRLPGEDSAAHRSHLDSVGLNHPSPGPGLPVDSDPGVHAGLPPGSRPNHPARALQVPRADVVHPWADSDVSWPLRAARWYCRLLRVAGTALVLLLMRSAAVTGPG